MSVPVRQPADSLNTSTTTAAESSQTDPVQGERGTTSRWRPHGIALIIALAGLLIGNHEPLLAWVDLWLHAGHDYGLVVLAACLWLIWRQRKELASVSLHAEPTALLAIAPLALALWVAYAIDVRIVQLALLVVSLAAVVLAVLGWPALRLLAGPIAMLCLALPIWNYFKSVLQELTVLATVTALRLIGTPVFVDETYINIPDRAIVVLAECSGSQYFQAGVTVGALYAYLNFRVLWLRLVTLTSFALVAIVGNWIRVDVLVFLSTLSETQHFMVGWGIFALLMTIAFAAAVRLQGYEDRALSSRPPISAAVTSAPATRGGSLVLMTCLSVLLLGAVPLTRHIDATSLSSQRLGSISVDAPWSGPYQAGDEWYPSFAGTDEQSIAAYRTPGADITVYRAFYAQQRQGAEVINEMNSVYDARWVHRGGYAGTDERAIQLRSGETLRVIETRLQHPDGRSERLVWHWYHVAGRNVVSPGQAKLAQVVGLMQGRSDAIVIALSTDGSDAAAAREQLNAFLRATGSTLTGDAPEVSR